MAKYIRILKRFGHKGQFVRYPNNWDRRITHTGKRRFDTSCDLLLGMCACGDRHTEGEGWIDAILSINHARIETHGEWVKRTRKKRFETENTHFVA